MNGPHRILTAGITMAVAIMASLPEDALAQGCAMCRTTLQGQNDPLVGAVNTSVLFLMTMPYLIVGTIGGWMYLGWRRTLGRPEASPSPTFDSVEGENP